MWQCHRLAAWCVALNSACLEFRLGATGNLGPKAGTDVLKEVFSHKRNKVFDAVDGQILKANELE